MPPIDFTCSQEERREISVAALCDCANSLGLGLSSGTPDASWIQQMLRTELPAFLASPDFEHVLSKDDRRRVEDVASSGITPKMLLAPTHIEVVALLSRLCLLGAHHPQVTDRSSIMTNVVEQAAISLRHAEVPAALHSVQRVAKRIEKAMRLPEALSWRAGIETDDIHTLC